MTFLTPATRFAPDEARVYTRRLLDRFRALPGVEAVEAISNLPPEPAQPERSFNDADRPDTGSNPSTLRSASARRSAPTTPASCGYSSPVASS